MSSIKVTPNTLIELGKDIKSLSEDYSEVLKDFKELINEIDSIPLWDGVDEVKYMSKMNERYFMIFDKIQVELNDYADYLEKSGNTYASVEEFLGTKEVDI